MYFYIMKAAKKKSPKFKPFKDKTLRRYEEIEKYKRINREKKQNGTAKNNNRLE